ncbi:MAG: hypothetical protein SGARI_004036 [Bacillariaceae sp.]
MEERLIQREWYDAEKIVVTEGVEVKGQWNMERMVEELHDIMDEIYEGRRQPDPKMWDSVLDGFDYVNYLRQANQVNLVKLEHELLRAGESPIPFNVLFRLMNKFELDEFVNIFMEAEEPPIYWFSGDAYAIFDSDRCSSYVQHLKPGVKFVYQDESRKWVGKELLRCEECKLYAETAREEHCASKYCFGQGIFCDGLLYMR